VNAPIDLSVYKETLLFLVTAGVVAPLFFRLHVSPVLGYLLAGLALGPYGLGSLDLKAPWLNALAINVEAIDRIAAFGVVALLFTMGLELSFERLRRMRRLVFGLGLAQVVVTILILSGVAWSLGLAQPSALTVGAALTMSSTAIVIPMLVESKRLHTGAGRASFAVLLFQDLAVAPLLVMTGAFSAGGERGLGWELLGALAPAGLALVALVVFGRLALRPFFHFVAETKSPEFFMAACLLVVLGDGLAAAASHLSMALGAFVAGLLLAETEYRREIEVTIEPFRGLLLGLYFVSVGAGINPAFIVARPGLILGLAAALAAAKGLTLFGLARAFRLPPRVAAEMSLLLGPGGEFGFVMIGAALAGGLIDRALATTLISAVAISMLAIPGLAKLGARIGLPLRAAVDKGALEIPPESEDSRVIIVGYGRVGALIGDMLDRHSIPFIAVDSDARLTTRARSDGKPVYYGDAARPEYLRHCGLETARAVVVTMDSPAANEAVVETTRRLRPEVTLVARARDANHARALYGLGVTDAVPETIEASLQLSEAVLVDLGVPMGLVIASIHEKRDEFRKLLTAAGAPERPRSTRGPRRR
jgi:monovalent cation:H+ antiporter-2, CPA2 family